jgi:hypothetical protein
MDLLETLFFLQLDPVHHNLLETIFLLSQLITACNAKYAGFFGISIEHTFRVRDFSTGVKGQVDELLGTRVNVAGLPL